MTRSTPNLAGTVLLAACLMGGLPNHALACATCFGDPNSPMARGAAMGIIFMIGVVGFVLASLVGTGVFWMVRSRRLHAHVNNTPPGAL